MKNIRVIEEWILVKPDKSNEGEQRTPGGLVIPLEAQKKQEVKRALVVQISQDIEEELHYKIGDVVLYYGKTGIPIVDNGEEFAFLKYDGMLAIEVPDASN
jgi:co-chaperonin GroES (HSP10)